MARFAVGLEKDFAAVCSAVETCWSNGQVEGQLNRLKTLKRQMYGRAGFALLRARLLPYVPLPFSMLAQRPQRNARATLDFGKRQTKLAKISRANRFQTFQLPEVKPR